MMNHRSSCIIREVSLPEREYRVSPPERWEGNVRTDRRPPRRRRRQRRRVRLLPALLALSLVFSFLLGRASASKRTAATPSVMQGMTRKEDLPDAAAGIPVSVLPAAPQTADPSSQPETMKPDSAAGTPSSGQVGGASSAPSAADPGSQPETMKPGSAAGTPPSGQTGGSSSAPSASDPSAQASDWNLVLINGDHALTKDYQVPALTQMANGHAIDSRAYPALQEMMDAARAAGVDPTICSSFRTWETQERLYRNKVARLKSAGWDPETVEQEAARWVARPGTSEHQAGLAVDIVDRSYQVLDHKQETTAAQKWLMAHCAEYGFILRYPSDKGDITGIGYEPWHYRYVGREAAQAIMSQGICLEEYIESLTKTV